MKTVLYNKALTSHSKRSGAEIIIVVLLLTIVVTLGYPHLKNGFDKSKLTEVFVHFTALKQDIDLFYHENGWMPNREELLADDDRSENSVVDFDYAVENGAVTYYMKSDVINGDYDNQYMISFRPTVNKKKPARNILWICGYQVPHDGFIVNTKNYTNISKGVLTSVCK